LRSVLQRAPRQADPRARARAAQPAAARIAHAHAHRAAELIPDWRGQTAADLQEPAVESHARDHAAPVERPRVEHASDLERVRSRRDRPGRAERERRRAPSEPRGGVDHPADSQRLAHVPGRVDRADQRRMGARREAVDFERRRAGREASIVDRTLEPLAGRSRERHARGRCRRHGIGAGKRLRRPRRMRVDRPAALGGGRCEALDVLPYAQRVRAVGKAEHSERGDAGLERRSVERAREGRAVLSAEAQECVVSAAQGGWTGVEAGTGQGVPNDRSERARGLEVAGGRVVGDHVNP